MKQMLTAKEVAEISNLKPYGVWELTRAGELPFAVRVGEKQLRFRPDGLEKWLAGGGNVNRGGETIKRND